VVILAACAKSETRSDPNSVEADTTGFPAIPLQRYQLALERALSRLDSQGEFNQYFRQFPGTEVAARSQQLLLPDEVRRLGRDTELLFVKGGSPLLTFRMNYREDAECSLGEAIPIRSTSPSPPRKLLSERSHAVRDTEAGLSPPRGFRSKSLSRSSRVHVFFGLIAFGVILAAAAGSVGLRFNLTSSLPIGVYRVINDSPTLERGAIVLYCLPQSLARFARDRGYVPKGGRCAQGLMPIGKVVAAIRGDTVGVTNGGITVNGKAQLHSRPLSYDRMGNRLPQLINGSYVVRPNYIWLLAPTDRSFDSRYLGQLIAESVVARVHPFWIVASGALRYGERP
jgi:conjugative transfer signal peptidase TraF